MSSKGRRGMSARARSRSSRSASMKFVPTTKRDRCALGVGVLERSEPAEETRPAGQSRRKAHRELRERLGDGRPVPLARADLLAEADQEYLGESALQLAGEGGVRFDAVDEEQVIGRGGFSVQRNGKVGAVFDGVDRRHRGSHGTTNGIGGDAERGEDPLLSLCRSAPVASHGWDDERFGAVALEPRDGHLDDRLEMVEAAAPHGDGDRVTGAERAADSRSLELFRDRVLDAPDPRPRESLADREEARRRARFH